MKLYKFRALGTDKDRGRILDIINNGFYCNDILGFNDMNEGVYANNFNNKGITLSEKQKYKICSFSGIKALNSELMWGHYANTGRGVIIEIEVEDCQNIEEVQYNNNDNLNTIEDILTNKSKEWVYEDEYRYLSTDNLVDNKVKIGKINKIHFGTPYEKLLNYQEIKSKHEDLRKYLKLKEDIISICKKNKILYGNFNMNV